MAVKAPHAISCTVPRCGDGKVNIRAGEDCDDANDIDTDACSSDCQRAICGDAQIWMDGLVCGITFGQSLSIDGVDLDEGIPTILMSLSKPIWCFNHQVVNGARQIWIEGADFESTNCGPNDGLAYGTLSYGCDKLSRGVVCVRSNDNRYFRYRGEGPCGEDNENFVGILTQETGCGAETCDDGNTMTEACDYGMQSCEVCTESCVLAAGDTSFQGDGLIDTDNGEDCDDGLGLSGVPEDGDGCAADGTVEQGYECADEPSVCTRFVSESCKTLHEAKPDWADGWYWIDPDNDGPVAAFEVYCDMTNGGWTQVIYAAEWEVNESDPPDFRYHSDIWSTGYSDPNHVTHLSKAWVHTPTFTEVSWLENGLPYQESISTDGSLSELVKTGGTIKFNVNLNSSFGPYGGRVFRNWQNLRCNTANSSTDWGLGLGSIRSCQRQYPTFYSEMHYDTIALWIR